MHRGRALDALAAAARIHAIAIQPNMRDGHWRQAQAGCELVLCHIPARQAPGYLPRLHGVLECLHADAARAAREGGDARAAQSHLHALIGYLSERRAPLARRITVLTELAYLHIADGDAPAGGRMLIGIGRFLAATASGPDGGPGPDLWRPRPRPSVPAQRPPAD